MARKAAESSKRISDLDIPGLTPAQGTRGAIEKNLPQPRSRPASDQEALSAIVLGPEIEESKRESLLLEIGELVLRKSKVLKDRNFELIGTRDLSFMAELYDELFLDGICLKLAKKDGLSFRWSRRMTSAGGKTTRTVWPGSLLRKRRTHYEIALSSSLLFQTFRDVDRPVKVCGRLCNDRMEAMQRILEHELIHLVEMLVWIDSNCAAPQFQGISRRLFGHTEHRHELITQRERAVQQFDIRLGMRVKFVYEGKSYEGVVNRITRRATILVEDRKGILFSDGRRYRKFYVPLSQLRK